MLTKSSVFFFLLTLLAADPDTPNARQDADPFVDKVVEFKVGQAGGFNADKLPEIVLGRPHGGGEFLGGSHVFSLGREGSITLEFVDNEVVDGEGIDLLIFENSIRPMPGTNANPGYDLAKVEVSEDGIHWKTFAFDTASRKGCAGHLPVFSNPDTEEGRDISPTDPAKAGGEGFDLAELGFKVVRFVRITDLGLSTLGGKTTMGFDLDAVAAVHSRARVATK
ncbi:MAG: hypothetical protein JWM11_5627 [Planctomycetaceae bacterium]|nr:hypothetical protein [Planctomycetaceae bacterium]